MDLSKRVSYDALYPVKLRDPETGNPVGVTINVVSLRSRDVARVETLGRQKALVAKMTRDNSGAVSMEDIESAEGIERAKVIAAVKSWDWADNEFGELGKNPECTPDNVAYVFDDPNSQWIVDQVYDGAAKLGNFTKK